VLTSLADLYANDPGKVRDYAGELTKGIIQAESIVTGLKESAPVTKELLTESVRRWKKRMDNEEGGANRAPKFPMPSNYRYLLRYSVLEKDEKLLEHVELTLKKMAFGGIYDQVHGGFARYSTDVLWKVPHFEKMLYDNAQLASLYIEAYLVTKNALYNEIAEGVLGFVKKEWFREQEGCFYSAYDADSDGEEGIMYGRKKILKNCLEKSMRSLKNISGSTM
jgi:uncharacterized protein YyaL (SSP411 family)